MTRHDLLVIGSGVTGLTTALMLRQQGLRPMVVEVSPCPGAQTEVDGLSAPVPPWQLPDRVLELMARSNELLPDLVARLGQATGVDCEYRNSGLLLIGEESARREAWLAERSMASRGGRVADFEPALAGTDRPALLLEQFSRLRNSRLARALILALAQKNVTVLAGRPVRRLRVTGNIVRGVELADGCRIGADAVVLAAGAASNPILFDSGLERVRIDPDQSSWLLFNPASRLLSHAVHAGDSYLLPLDDGRILAGSLVAGGADRDGVDELLARVANWLPALSRFDLEGHGRGPCPASGGLPAIGAYPHMRGLWLNGGHERNGLGIAPAAAEILTQQLTGGPILSDVAVRLA